MKRAQTAMRFAPAVLVAGFLTAGLFFSRDVSAAEPPHPNAAVADDGALFLAFVPVLRHPRCMNCHSQGDYPRKGDDSHPHTMDVHRGPAAETGSGKARTGSGNEAGSRYAGESGQSG